MIPEKNAIKGALRRLFTRSTICKEVRESAIHPTRKGPRGGKMYICKKCGGVYPAKSIQVDHIRPVIKPKETIHDLDYNTLVKRIFCSKRNLQVLCKDCHKTKTTKERKEKAKWRKKMKKGMP